jgi:hypothetical protein
MRISLLLTLPLCLAGCAFEENLPEQDFVGKVVIPAAAGTRQPVNADGTLGDPVTDARFLGPVYLGAFAAIDNEAFPYPHPAMGPVVNAGYPGNTFPYGGTTVGRLDFGCFESVSCRVTTGRYSDFDSMIEYFEGFLNDPITDEFGRVVSDANTLRQACYDRFDITSDQELAFLGDLDFTQNADGDFEASFTLPHTLYVENMVVWGWMDAPRITSAAGDVDGTYSSCDTNTGREWNEYDQQFEQGRGQPDLLNYPSLYIFADDWVADGLAVVDALDSEVVVNLNIPVTEAR